MKKILFLSLSAFVLLSCSKKTEVSYVERKSVLEDTMKDDTSSRSVSAAFAEEEFRLGVQSFNRGQFNESIRVFEQALSHLPGENMVLDWLGKAYYRSGEEGSALQQWNFAASQGYGGILLQNRIEIVKDRRITEKQYGFKQNYTKIGTFSHENKGKLVFSQPVSALPLSDGSLLVAAYGSNEILHFNVNGDVLDRNRGPLNGFDRPLDIIRLSSGNLLVSEMAGDRLSLLSSEGDFIRYIGSRGTGLGQMVGPQYLAEDSHGNIYVTDGGNNRVDVFDSEGKGLFSFGDKNSVFEGFGLPTGIAVVNDSVYVADRIRGGIYIFDRFGNYTGVLVRDGSLRCPESMRLWGKDAFVLTDVNVNDEGLSESLVKVVDISSGALHQIASSGHTLSKYTSAISDANGNLVVTDFAANEVDVLTGVDELAGGLFVQIERVISDNFPKVILEVRVENRKRQQIVGLNKANFIITEQHHAVNDVNFIGAANYNDFADIVFVIDRSLQMKNYEEQLNQAVREISRSMGAKGNITIISAGKNPVLESSGHSENYASFSYKDLKASYTDSMALDLALRLGANDLVNREKKRGIIFITTGKTNHYSFTKYSLSDLSTYLNNNAISMSTISLTDGSLDEAVSYLTENTSGDSYYVYRPEGISSVIDDIIALPSGLYQFEYTSSMLTDYGRRYLPVEVETYLHNRSGRDETGYFAPLE
ncbi:VWA domain-containing protein [Treponema sp.]|uniref:VWA domain-containing protein n=1 Tax=Treponema sp. TaxID=166 RepID=UPI0025CC316E|nr:VWA domain-containing protein [Treponema sp.]MCR5218763.1 VWA domain-containing protein [Treponema sp.]